MKEKSLVQKLLIFITSIFVLVFACSASVLAASNRGKTKKPWAAAYKKIVKELETEYKDSDVKITYDLIFFNDDMTPELVAGMNDYWVSMYTYDKGKVYTVMDQWGYGAMGNAGYSYYPKKNVLVNYDNDFAGLRYYTYYGKMKNHEMVDLHKKSLRIDYFIDKNQDGMPQEEEYSLDNPIYYYGEKKISEKKYNKYLVQGDTKDIRGRYSKKKILKKLS